MTSKRLDDFQVQWSPSERQDFIVKPPLRQETPYSPVKYFFGWQESDSKGNIRPTGQRFLHLFSRGTELSDEEEWKFQRPLGKGSFGAAALFVKLDGTGKPIDNFVLKVADLKPNDRLSDKKIGLSREAAIMAQTNALGSDSIVRLRHFNVSDNYGRYYFEHCPHNCLESLRLSYKAWDMYLPEAFLWQVFCFLAEGCVKFDSGPFKNLASSRFGQDFPEAYLLHNDIKTDNILLGSNVKKDGSKEWYPVAKFADFGLFIITNRYEALRNTARFLQRGTKPWHPPEIRVAMMTDPKKYYFMQPGINPSQRDQHKILSKANIWAVGAVMWSLTSLGEIQNLSNQTDAILMGIFPLDGVNILQEFEGSVTRNYSPQLLGMIKKRLRMRTQDRPTAEDLFREVFSLRQECLEKETERANRTGDWHPLYLWCTPDELNELGSGEAISDDKDRSFWETTGATGYTGGQALHAIAASTPASQVSITCLVRSAEKGKVVQDAYPDYVKVVVGDLDDVEVVEKQSQKSDVVLQLADTKHMGAAHAIVKGLTSRSRTTGSPATYIQMSGDSLFVIPEIESKRYGEPPTTIWDDMAGQPEIIENIRAYPSREVDNYIISDASSTGIRTALVVGPLIYGTGPGPGNTRSIQAPEIARKTISDGSGFKLRKGLNVWSNIHIEDLGELFATLARTAGQGSSTSTGNTSSSAADLDIWGENGVYLPGNGDMSFGDLCEAVATEAHAQGLIKSATIDRTIDVDEANAAMPGGAIFWGTNAVYKSERAQILLGWKPSAPSLQDTIPEIVRVEAEKLKS
ncbi:hypothetical protein PV08_10380 [Exophiala spinifera]|uniref:Protein kinase domain-containing protein n=1 Tax=Exophiala spinifera TaxID=91928 RepID=A0A0D1Y814_9EURO|nr:uncharacterized protein PV08_10380 [Exophiala spinifera]KIW11081.1 hypothetical protein PV08_10380 [Exophiala spinifera]